MTVGTDHFTLGDLGYDCIPAMSVAKYGRDIISLISEMVKVEGYNIFFSTIYARMGAKIFTKELLIRFDDLSFSRDSHLDMVFSILGVVAL